ncbi:hypothetical protein OQA88_10917 [Cercophora sp. LCS_1]
MHLLQPLLGFLSLAGFTTAQTPTPPPLTYLYTVNATLGAALPVGNSPRGNRAVIPITGGSFKGPAISGKVHNLGADWGLTDAGGTFFADTRYHLETDDGAHIFIQTNGPAQADGRLHLRIQFETGSGRYYWLNYVVAVGVLRVGDGWVVIDVWQLVSPPV